MPIGVSIIIPAFNEEEFIGACLQSLYELHCNNTSYEVILVDNDSVDSTCKIANSFLDKLDLKVIVQKDVNISALRNLGVSYAKGTILAFLDADCTVSRQWLNVAVPYFNDPSLGAVGSSHLTPEGISWIAKTWDIVISEKRQKGYTLKLPSGNLWVSSEKFLELNGFNEELVTNEDFDLCYRLSGRGYKIFSDPAIKAWHWGVPRTLGEFYKKNRWHGIHVFKVFLESLPKFNNVKPILFGFYYLVVAVLIPIVFINVSLFLALISSAIIFLTPSLSLSWRVIRNKNKSFTLFLKLLVLYFVYGMARAHSILDAMGSFSFSNKK